MAGSGDITALQHKLDCFFLLLYCLLLILTILTIWVLKSRKILFVHETGLAILYGLIIGIIMKYSISVTMIPEIMTKLDVIPEKKSQVTFLPPKRIFIDFHYNDTKYTNKWWVYDIAGNAKYADQMERDSFITQNVRFNPEIFMDFILPNIIFYAAYTMERNYFFKNIGSICTFAFIGTTKSIFLVSGIMYGITRLCKHLTNITYLETLRFGAIISSIDPIGIIAIFNDLNIDMDLYAILFGESIFNNVVCILLVQAIDNYSFSTRHCYHGNCFDFIHFFTILGDFVGMFIASFLIGSLVGCINAIITKFTHLKDHPTLETVLFILMSFMSFYITETLGLVGIVSLLFCGITQGHYTYYNLSDQSKVSTKRFCELVSLMSENIIFSYMGLCIFTIPRHKFDAIFIGGAFVAIFISRSLNIYPLSAILNLGRTKKISGSLQHMLFFSGLRGAVAFALSIKKTKDETQDMILTTTTVIIIILTIINGGFLVTLVNWLGFVTPSNKSSDSSINDKMESGEASNKASNSSGGPSSRQQPKSAKDKCIHFDNRYMKPMLTHFCPSPLDSESEEQFYLAKLFTSQQQDEERRSIGVELRPVSKPIDGLPGRSKES